MGWPSVCKEPIGWCPQQLRPEAEQGASQIGIRVLERVQHICEKEGEGTEGLNRQAKWKEFEQHSERWKN